MTHLKTPIITFAALMAVSAMGASMAEKVNVSKFTYQNKGEYNAYFNVRYNQADGTNCSVYLNGEAYTGTKVMVTTSGAVMTKNRVDSVTVDLTSIQFKSFKGGSGCKGEIPDGTRVWGKVYIDAGDNESCKKSVELIKQGSGKTVSYRTGGTTLKDNRCKQDIK